MTRVPVPPEERQAKLLEELRKRISMTVNDAWEFGYHNGLYFGADGQDAKKDLNALVQRNQATLTDGFWRHLNEPDHIRRQYARWADYWTAKGHGR